MDQAERVRICTRKWVEIPAEVAGFADATLQLETGQSDEDAVAKCLPGEAGHAFRISALEARLQAVRSGFPVELPVEPGGLPGFVTSLRLEPGPSESQIVLKIHDVDPGRAVQADDLEEALQTLRRIDDLAAE